MAADRVVLVTGVSRDLGSRFARSLAADEHVEVVGIDVIPPRQNLGMADFVRADIRNPVISKVIATRGVDTVVHLAVVATPGAGGRSSMKEINVIGTMQLLAACQKAETFRKLVVQSSISVYGASPRDPAKFTEDMSARAQPRTGFGKDSLEIESYVRGLGRRRPDVVVTTLRLANLMGAGVDSHVTRYLSLPVVPRVMGFDARLQFLHPNDAVAALLLATSRDFPGTFNVGAADIVTLSQALRKMGRPSFLVPQSAAPLVATLVRQCAPGGLLHRPDRRPDLWSCHGHVSFHCGNGLCPAVQQPRSAGGVRQCRQAWVVGRRARRRRACRSGPAAQVRDGAKWLTRRSSSSAATALLAAGAAAHRRHRLVAWQVLMRRDPRKLTTSRRARDRMMSQRRLPPHRP